MLDVMSEVKENIILCSMDLSQLIQSNFAVFSWINFFSFSWYCSKTQHTSVNIKNLRLRGKLCWVYTWRRHFTTTTHHLFRCRVPLPEHIWFYFNQYRIQVPMLHYTMLKWGQQRRGAQLHSLVGAECQVGGVVHSCWCSGMMDGSSGKIKNISSLQTEKIIHL